MQAAGKDENEFQAARAYDMLFGREFNSVEALLNDSRNFLSRRYDEGTLDQTQASLRGATQTGVMTDSAGRQFDYSSYFDDAPTQ